MSNYSAGKYANGWNEPEPEGKGGGGDYDDKPLKPGTYTVSINNVLEKQTRSGGDALSVWLDVEDNGPAYGKRVFDWINLDLPNSPQATEIGQRTFRRLCKACGFVDGPPADLGELLGCSLTVKLGIKPARGDYKASNTVKMYLPLGNEPAPFKPQAPDVGAQDIDDLPFGPVWMP